ncbi:hypothetical protein DVH05_006917 [Phytophthora capsici]|nr:hypothetical protein DVH05_006917 [Phytophthora capsici]
MSIETKVREIKAQERYSRIKGTPESQPTQAERALVAPSQDSALLLSKNHVTKFVSAVLYSRIYTMDALRLALFPPLSLSYVALTTTGCILTTATKGDLDVVVGHGIKVAEVVVVVVVAVVIMVAIAKQQQQQQQWQQQQQQALSSR